MKTTIVALEDHRKTGAYQRYTDSFSDYYRPEVNWSRPISFSTLAAWDANGQPRKGFPLPLLIELLDAVDNGAQVKEALLRLGVESMTDLIFPLFASLSMMDENFVSLFEGLSALSDMESEQTRMNFLEKAKKIFFEVKPETEHPDTALSDSEKLQFYRRHAKAIAAQVVINLVETTQKEMLRDILDGWYDSIWCLIPRIAVYCNFRWWFNAPPSFAAGTGSGTETAEEIERQMLILFYHIFEE